MCSRSFFLYFISALGLTLVILFPFVYLLRMYLLLLKLFLLLLGILLLLQMV